MYVDIIYSNTLREVDRNTNIVILILSLSLSTWSWSWDLDACHAGTCVKFGPTRLPVNSFRVMVRVRA